MDGWTQANFSPLDLDLELLPSKSAGIHTRTPR
jgi:hypothetical protein